MGSLIHACRATGRDESKAGPSCAFYPKSAIIKSLLAAIDYPAAADVRAGAAAMAQDGGVLAPGFLQRVGQDRHAVEGALVVDCVG